MNVHGSSAEPRWHSPICGASFTALHERSDRSRENAMHRRRLAQRAVWAHGKRKPRKGGHCTHWDAEWRYVALGCYARL